MSKSKKNGNTKTKSRRNNKTKKCGYVYEAVRIDNLTRDALRKFKRRSNRTRRHP